MGHSVPTQQDEGTQLLNHLNALESSQEMFRGFWCIYRKQQMLANKPQSFAQDLSNSGMKLAEIANKIVS